MPAYTQELTETLTLGDTVLFKQPGVVSLYIDEVNFNDLWEYIKFKERLNEIYSFEIRLSGVTSALQSMIKEGKIVRIYYGSTEIFKGNMDAPEYSTDEECMITGIQAGQKIARGWDFNKSTTPSTGFYRESSAVAASTILTRLASQNCAGTGSNINIVVNGVTKTLNVGTNSVATTTRFRGEGDTKRIQSFFELAKLVNSDCYFNTDGSDNDQVNLAARLGSATSVKTFYTSGDNQNADVANKITDESQLWNAVVVLGYGDGTNQIRSTSQEDATSIAAVGRREKTWPDRRIKNSAEADTLATKIKNEHLNAVKRFTLRIEDEDEILPTKVALGDNITIVDDTILRSGESGEYRVVGREVVFSQDEGNYIFLECNSRTLEFNEEMIELLERMNNTDSYGIMNDPGHNHTFGFTDPSHNHGQNISDPNHNHNQNISDPNHSHSVTGTTSTQNGFSTNFTSDTSANNTSLSNGAWTTVGTLTPPSSTNSLGYGHSVKIILTFTGGAAGPIGVRVVNSAVSLLYHESWHYIAFNTAQIYIWDYIHDAAKNESGLTLEVYNGTGTTATISSTNFEFAHFVALKHTHDVSGQTASSTSTGISGGSSTNVSGSTGLSGGSSTNVSGSTGASGSNTSQTTGLTG